MPWFKREQPTYLAIERLEDRFKQICVDIDDLKSANKRLQLEWTETYDKVRHQMARMARRGDLTPANNGQDLEPGDDTQESEVDPISAKILARRGRMFMGVK